jgi:hypothetical protein
MKLWVPGVPAIFRRRTLSALIIIVLVAGLGIYWFHFRADRNKLKQVDAAPTRTATIQPEIKEADSSLSKKDYQAAADSYLAAASDALASNQPKQAEAILQQAVTLIPSQNLPFYIYSALAQVAHQLGDSALEKQSLEQAIQKASAPGSGIAPASLAGLQDRLKAIK